MEKEVIRVWFCNRRQKEKRINPCSAAPMLPSPGKPASYSPHLVPEPLGAQSSATNLPGNRHLCGAQLAWLGAYQGGSTSHRDTEFPGNCGLMWGIQAPTHTNIARQLSQDVATQG